MKDEKYNGWTNYETWRVNLELFDGYELNEQQKELDAYDLKEELKDFVELIINEQSELGTIANDYAHAFINAVNWLEIAESLKG